MGVPHIEKSGAIVFPTRWHSNVHCILQGLLVGPLFTFSFVLMAYSISYGTYLIFPAFMENLVASAFLCFIFCVLQQNEVRR